MVLQIINRGAIGREAGNINQDEDCIAIGSAAGQESQSYGTVAIGSQAGKFEQKLASISICAQAGCEYQGTVAIAIGAQSGFIQQKDNAIALGLNCAQFTQGEASVVIGSNSANQNQHSNSIAIGSHAGFYNQGSYAIAIGYYAGFTSQIAESIIINASSVELDSTVNQPSCYINPIRDNATNNVMYYNTSSKEVTYQISVGDLKFSVLSSDHNSWLLCNGGTKSISAYPTLASVLGSTYGPYGPINFTLPNGVPNPYPIGNVFIYSGP